MSTAKTLIPRARTAMNLICSMVLATLLGACETSSGGAGLDLPELDPTKTSAAGRSPPPTRSSNVDARFQSLALNEAPSATAYQVGPSDVLAISVFRVPELTTDIQVASDGTVTLPLVGILKVGGKQSQEIGGIIASRLRAKYLQSPQVTVFVKSYNSQKVVVSGAVARPGTIAMTGDTTLLSAISEAKGFTDVADAKRVMVFRKADGRKYAARFNVDDIQSGKAADPLLMTGDLIVVDSSDAKSWMKTLLPVLSTAGIFIALL